MCFLLFRSVVLIAESAFYNCGLEKLVVPSSVMFIGEVDLATVLHFPHLLISSLVICVTDFVSVIAF
jgi:hypothetical protein